PVLGRFLSRDPLGRAPLFFSDQPYGYAGNNPLVYVDPSGQRIMSEEAVHQVHRKPTSKPTNRGVLLTVTVHRSLFPSACSPFVFTTTRHWWGLEHFMNECAVQYMNIFNGLGWAVIASVEGACIVASAGCAALLSAIAGVTVTVAVTLAVVTIIIIVAVIVEQGYATWVNNNDAHCGHRGVFVDQAWGGATGSIVFALDSTC
ncbi:MAG: hypothetical protein ACRD3W_29040, partial [Terriglobales bacterium]